MDFQTAFNYLMGAGGAVGMWLLTTAHSSMKELKDKLQSIELLVAGQYVKRSEFEGRMEKFADKLDAIYEKLVKGDKGAHNG
jgi:hypothetical protein